MLEMIFGVNHDMSNSADVNKAIGASAYTLVADAGLKAIRYTVYLPYVNPAPGVWDFALPDIEIKAAIDAGLEVYVNLMWAPAHASSDKPAYMPFTAGCSVARIASDGSIAVDFASDKDFCRNPPSIDGIWLRDVTSKVVSRYAALGVKHFGLWNEANYDVFFPPRTGDAKFDVIRYVEEVVRPFTEAAREAAPNVVLVGPEMDDIWTTNAVLSAEYRLGERWFDVISFHGYGHSPEFPAKAIERTGAFLAEVGANRQGRAVWITEVGGNPMRPTEAGLEQQRAEIADYVLKTKDFFADSISRIYLYRIKRDPGEVADHGLILSNGSRTPALEAIRLILRGATELPQLPYSQLLTRAEFMEIRPLLQPGDTIMWDEGSGMDVDYVVFKAEPGRQMPKTLTRLEVVK